MGAFLWTRFEGGDGPGGWVIVYEPELHLGARPDVLVPDLAGWREARFPEPAEGEDPPYFTVPPDWVAEILSPGTAGIDRMKKVPIYAREGVTHVWLVDPRETTVEVLRLEGPAYRLVGTWGGEDEELALEPFDAALRPHDAHRLAVGQNLCGLSSSRSRT